MNTVDDRKPGSQLDVNSDVNADPKVHSSDAHVCPTKLKANQPKKEPAPECIIELKEKLARLRAEVQAFQTEIKMDDALSKLSDLNAEQLQARFDRLAELLAEDMCDAEATGRDMSLLEQEIANFIHARDL